MKIFTNVERIGRQEYVERRESNIDISLRDFTELSMLFHKIDNDHIYYNNVDYKDRLFEIEFHASKENYGNGRLILKSRISIRKLKDEYFIASKSNIQDNFYGITEQFYFLVDQIDGLIEFLKDHFEVYVPIDFDSKEFDFFEINTTNRRKSILFDDTNNLIVDIISEPGFSNARLLRI